MANDLLVPIAGGYLHRHMVVLCDAKGVPYRPAGAIDVVLSDSLAQAIADGELDRHMVILCDEAGIPYDIKNGI